MPPRKKKIEELEKVLNEGQIVLTDEKGKKIIVHDPILHPYLPNNQTLQAKFSNAWFDKAIEIYKMPPEKLKFIWEQNKNIDGISKIHLRENIIKKEEKE